MRVSLITALLATLAIALHPAVGRSQAPSGFARIIERADSLARVGELEEAEPLYSFVVQWTKDSALLAAGAFGRAYTMQSRLEQLPDSLRNALVDSVIADYQTASRLDSVRFFPPTQNNIGVLRLDAGRPKEALPAFLAAVRGTAKGESPAQYYANAGRAYQALNFVDSATVAYRNALKADSSQLIARRALLNIYERAIADDSLLNHISRLAEFKLDLDLIVETLTRSLVRSKPPLGAAQADRALVLLCGVYGSMGMSPDYFTKTQTYPLSRVIGIHPELLQPISAITGAMAAVGTGELPLLRISESWWRTPPIRRLAWSTLLRAAGDHYRSQQRNDVAVVYYETAIGRERERINPRQVDLAAFPGLLRSYGTLGRLKSIDSVAAILRNDLGEGRTLRGRSRELLRDSYFVAGSKLLDSLRYRGALEQFRNAISVDSLFAASYASIGYIYVGLERPDLALSYAERAVSLDKNDPTARNNLGFALFLNGDYRQAIEHLEASYFAAPSLLTVINLGLAHRFAGNLEGAVRWHTEAVKEVTGNRSADEWYVGGAWIYSYTPQRAGDRQTIKHSIRVTDLSHKRAVATFALSLDEAVSGKQRAAEGHFIEATKLASEPAFRCFFANEIVATRNRLKKMSISTDARRWLEAMRGELARGAACPV